MVRERACFLLCSSCLVSGLPVLFDKRRKRGIDVCISWILRFQKNTGGRQEECLMSVLPDEIRFLSRASSESKEMHQIVSADQVSKYDEGEQYFRRDA